MDHLLPTLPVYKNVKMLSNSYDTRIRNDVIDLHPLGIQDYGLIRTYIDGFFHSSPYSLYSLYEGNQKNLMDRIERVKDENESGKEEKEESIPLSDLYVNLSRSNFTHGPTNKIILKRVAFMDHIKRQFDIFDLHNNQAKIIQTYWRQAISDPNYKICRKWSIRYTEGYSSGR